MRSLISLVVAVSLSATAVIAVGPPRGGAAAPGDVLAEAALKCNTAPSNAAAIILDGAVAWSGRPLRELSLEEFDEMVGNPDLVVYAEIICRPMFERLGVDAHQGLFVVTRASGVQSLPEAMREIHALQAAHRDEHGRWGESLEELGFTAADARLSIELAAEAYRQTWSAQGTHSMGIRRCEITGSVADGENEVDGTVEDAAAPTCQRMDATDEDFPSLVESNPGSR